MRLMNNSIGFLVKEVRRWNIRSMNIVSKKKILN